MSWLDHVNKAYELKKLGPQQRADTQPDQQVNIQFEGNNDTQNNIADNQLCNEPKIANKENQPADIFLLTALNDPEFQSLLSVFNFEWANEIRDGIMYKVANAKIGGRYVRIAGTWQTEMGMVAAAITTTKAIKSWSPKIVAFSGICAGNKNKDIHFGDIIVATDTYDYGSGKIHDGKFKPSFSPSRSGNLIINLMQNYASDRLTKQSISNKWTTKSGRPETELEIHFGSLGSGSAVIAQDDFFTDLQHKQRRILGIDMESYGVAQAVEQASGIRPHLIICKGVQDMASSDKNDQYREYASLMSASFVYLFIESNISNLLG